MNQLYKNKLGYAFYDFANSGYVLLFQAFLFPLFISSHYTDSSAAAQVWGYILFFSNLLAILSAPLIGRVADLKDRIKIFSILILSVSLLSFLSVLNNNVLVILIFFVIFNSSFELSQSIYDSFLNVISKNRDEKIDISTFAWGFGYLGGILFVLVYFVLNKNGIENKYILASAALLYFIFSFLSVFLLKKADQAHTRTFVNEMTNKNLKLFKLSKEIIYSLVIYFIVFFINYCNYKFFYSLF
jgi:MFS-type transporter involved in bile tolerance (Atg22 family)